MGFFLDEDTPAASTGGLPGGFFLDEPEAVEPETSTRDYIMGGLKGVAKAGTDLIAAPADLMFRAGNEALDYLTGADTNLEGGYPSDYRNKILEYISGGEGDQTTEDVVQTVGNLGTVIAVPSQAGNIASKIPLLGKAAETSKVANLASKAIGYGAEGAGYTALFNPKSETLIDDMTTGASINMAVPAVLKGAGSLAKGLSNKFANAADETLERGLGIQYGDRTKGLNRVNLYVDEAGEIVPFDKLDDAVGIQAPIQQQVKTLEEAGILANAPNDAQALKIHLTKAQKEIGKTIPALAREADQVIGTKEILPEFENTYKFLQGYRDSTRAGLIKEFDSILDDYVATPGTGLQKLNKFTDQLQKETSFDSAIPAAQTKLKRMVAYDLRKAAEREFDTALPQRAGEFAKANQIYSAAEAIGKTLNKRQARKMPELGDYLKGGSLPMTVLTGVASSFAGVPAAATVVGGKIATNAAKEYAEAAFPMSMSRFYDKMAGKSDSIKKLTDAGIDASKVFSALSGSSQSPELGDQELVPQEEKQISMQPRVSESQSLFSPTSYNSRLFAVDEQPSLFNVPGNSGLSQGEENMYKGQPVKDVISAVKSNPVDYAIAKMESNFDPKAKNPTSSASGLFQLVNKTAGSLGVENVFDAGENYDGYLKLKQSTIDKFGIEPDDYRAIYASHYLGENTLRKWLDGKELTGQQRDQVKYLTEKLFPKLDKFYQEALKQQTGQVIA